MCFERFGEVDGKKDKEYNKKMAEDEYVQSH